jgi:hypothetical protein
LPGATGKRKVFRLADVVQPLLEGQIEKLTSGAVKRILDSEKNIAQSGMAHVSRGPSTSHFVIVNMTNQGTQSIYQYQSTHSLYFFMQAVVCVSE